MCPLCGLTLHLTVQMDDWVPIKCVIHRTIAQQGGFIYKVQYDDASQSTGFVRWENMSREAQLAYIAKNPKAAAEEKNAVFLSATALKARAEWSDSEDSDASSGNGRRNRHSSTKAARKHKSKKSGKTRRSFHCSF